MVEEYRYFYKNDTLYEVSEDSLTLGEYKSRYVMNIVDDSLTVNYYVDSQSINDLSASAENDSVD